MVSVMSDLMNFSCIKKQIHQSFFIHVGGGRRTDFSLMVKFGDHIIPQTAQFKYHGSIMQNDGE